MKTRQVYCTKCDARYSCAFDPRAVDPLCPRCGCEDWSLSCRARVDELVGGTLRLVPWIVQRVSASLGAKIAARLEHDLLSAGQLALLKSARRFDPDAISPHTGERIKFTSYACAAIERHLFREIQRQRRETQIPERYDVAAHTNVNTAQLCQHYLAQLSPQYREVIEATFLQGEKTKEAAERLGITHRRAQNIKAAALRILRVIAGSSPLTREAA